MKSLSRRRLLAALPAVAVVGVAYAKDEQVSDDLVFDLVNQRIISDPDLGARPLRITVADGKVTVTGSVETEKLRKKVDKVVRKVRGVRAVDNQVVIRQ